MEIWGKKLCSTALNARVNLLINVLLMVSCCMVFLLSINLVVHVFSVRQRMFYVGSTAYSRSEVVAMEWLVQEVLNFQCYLPTMYNFLWYVPSNHALMTCKLKV